MLANERHNKILELLSKGGVTTSFLVEKFGISIETVRRDLLALEKQGLLTRVHGGALRKGAMNSYPVLKMRKESHSDAKRELSLKAAELVSDGDIIGIDSGSTAVFFAEALKERNLSLTVVTYSLDVFNILSGSQGIKLILLGGQFLPEERAFVGFITARELSLLHVKSAFVFSSAVSFEHGIADFNENICPLQTQLIESADNVYILADSSKFEKNALIKISDMSDSFTYVTDSALDSGLRELLLERGYKIL